MKSKFRIAALLATMLVLNGGAWAEDSQPNSANEEYEMDSWTSAKEINTIEAYDVYLSEYPNGRHAKFAQAAMNKIKKAENPKGSEENTPKVKEGGDAAGKKAENPGGKEATPPPAKEAGDAASKQAPAVVTSPLQSASAEAPAASGAEAKSIPPEAAPSAAPGVEGTPKQ